jgi:hypothetical protein
MRNFKKIERSDSLNPMIVITLRDFRFEMRKDGRGSYREAVSYAFQLSRGPLIVCIIRKGNEKIS